MDVYYNRLQSENNELKIFRIHERGGYVGNIALMIFAVAFAVLVIFLILVLHKVSKVVEEANRTVKLVSSDVDVLLHQADALMAKANTLLEDVNGKVATIDPLFTAVADLSESISAVNDSSRKLVARFTKTKRRGASAVVLAKNTKKFFVKSNQEKTKTDKQKATEAAFDEALKATEEAVKTEKTNSVENN